MIHFKHSFPETTWMGTLNKLVTLELAQQFPPYTLILDGTHLWDFDLESFARRNPKHFYVVCFSDPARLAVQELEKYFEPHKYTIIAPTNYSFFGRYCYDVFYNNFYNKSFPCDPDYVFMSYNRKPREHRVRLVSEIMNHKLLDHGIVTLGQYNDPSRVETDVLGAINTSEYSTFTEDVNIDPFDNAVKDMPNDITTLGNMELWSSCLVNVVSEVSIMDLFVTEKTFKPIIGMRPFMFNAAPGTLALLKSWGFKTFDEYWDEGYDNETNWIRRVEAIIDNLLYLSHLPHGSLIAIHEDMQPILTYNHNHFFNEFQDLNNQNFEQIGKAFPTPR